MLTSGKDVAVKDEKKAEMMAKAFVQVQSSVNVSEEEASENKRVLERREDVKDALNAPFTMAE